MADIFHSPSLGSNLTLTLSPIESRLAVLNSSSDDLSDLFCGGYTIQRTTVSDGTKNA